MTHKDDIILDFVAALAAVKDSHREVAAGLQHTTGVESVEIRISPSQNKKPNEFQPEYAERGVTLALFLDAIVEKEGPAGQNILGLSILLRRSLGPWIVEGELGWAGGEVGWDNFEDRELTAATVREIIDALPQFARELTDRYRTVMTKHLAS